MDRFTNIIFCFSLSLFGLTMAGGFYTAYLESTYHSQQENKCSKRGGTYSPDKDTCIQIKVIDL